jgi:DNA-binding NtrC family response regulator
MARKPNILLVDDQASVREALGQALRDENFQVVLAANGRDALREFRQNQIDVALLDLNLGRQESGWDTFQALTELAPLLPIIVMSAQAERFNHPLARCARGFLEKPFHPDFLFQTLQPLTVSASETFSTPTPPSALAAQDRA